MADKQDTNRRKDKDASYEEKSSGVQPQAWTETENEGHNVKKQALGPNTRR